MHEVSMTYNMRVQHAIAKLQDGVPEEDIREIHGLVVVREAKACIEFIAERVKTPVPAPSGGELVIERAVTETPAEPPPLTPAAVLAYLRAQ